MNSTHTLPKLLAVFFVIIGLASCEEDFSTLTTDVIDQPLNAELNDGSTVVSYSRKLLPVQTNGMSAYRLGVYNDPFYGKSTSNFLSQVYLNEIEPDFGNCPVLDSVVLYLPYFSEGTTEDGDTTFALDSLYGNAPIKLSVYESNYFLRDLDPDTNFEDPQRYFSNQATTIENFLGDLLYEDPAFLPNDDVHVIFENQDPDDDSGNSDERRLITLDPGIRVVLPNDIFQDRIIDQEGTSELLNNNNFREYFRGIYFKAESVGNEGNFFLFDLDNGSDVFRDANITLYYSGKEFDDEDDNCLTPDLEKTFGSLTLTFSGVSTNTIDSEFTPNILSDLSNPNTNNGEETLYVRGGDGIISIIELFGNTDEISVVDGVDVLGENGVPDELDRLRDQNALINEANLIVYVDDTQVPGGNTEPERLIIYNTASGALLSDYALDLTQGANEDVDAYVEHLGRLERGSNGNGDFYKLRITNHLSNIINNDSLNAPLGLIVSSNVTDEEFQELENSQAPGIYRVPTSSVISPEGTVLYGNNTANDAKRLRLQIWFTEINED